MLISMLLLSLLLQQQQQQQQSQQVYVQQQSRLVGYEPQYEYVDMPVQVEHLFACVHVCVCVSLCLCLCASEPACLPVSSICLYTHLGVPTTISYVRVRARVT